MKHNIRIRFIGTTGADRRKKKREAIAIINLYPIVSMVYGPTTDIHNRKTPFSLFIVFSQPQPVKAYNSGTQALFCCPYSYSVRSKP